jgi:hypothetical protein
LLLLLSSSEEELSAAVAAPASAARSTFTANMGSGVLRQSSATPDASIAAMSEGRCDIVQGVCTMGDNKSAKLVSSKTETLLCFAGVTTRGQH